MTAQRALLPGRRLHFAHGPIDLVIGADGEAEAVAAAHEAAWQRFVGVLPELVAELPALRRPVGAACGLQGPIARRMWQACRPYGAGCYITPMAAVAGAVAQEIIVAYQRAGVSRAWVNNGGDIALHLAPGQSVRVGLFADLARIDSVLASGTLAGGALTDDDVPAGGALVGGAPTGDAPAGGAPGLDGAFTVSADSAVRGIATSGWRGRSFSLGIADSVTVLAATAAQADAAATIIANAVNVDDARIVRRPACELKDDTDLGDLPVTVEVPRLEAATVRRALAAGMVRARALRAAGLIAEAVLVCQGQALATGHEAGQPSRANRAPTTGMTAAATETRTQRPMIETGTQRP